MSVAWQSLVHGVDRTHWTPASEGVRGPLAASSERSQSGLRGYSESVSVTCVLALPGEITDPKAAELMPAIEMRNVLRSPERVAWRLLVASAARWTHPTSPPSVGIIVDSELDLLSDINLRKVPVDGDFMLPTGFELIYASADASGDDRVNPLIREADSQSDSLFGVIAANAADRRFLHPVANEAFSSMRWWKHSQDGGWKAGTQ